jgi:hypothetical protein
MNKNKPIIKKASDWMNEKEFIKEYSKQTDEVQNAISDMLVEYFENELEERLRMKNKIMSYYIVCGFGWIRVFGIGIKWKDTTKHNLIFSERIGKKKYLKIGKYAFGYLPKIKK